MRLSMSVLASAFGLGDHAVAADTAVPSDWIEVAAGNMFTIRAPAGTTFERLRTGDAFAGMFHGPGFDLAVEFGYHREGLKIPQGISNPKATTVVLDEKPGTITMAGTADAAHPYFAGLHVPSVERDVFGPLSLVVSGNVARPEDQAIVQRIYETVKFGYKN